MKKTALLLALLMIVGPVAGFCYPATVDNILEDKSKSDLRPVADTAKMAGALNDGINQAFEMEPLHTIDKVRIETYNGAKKVTNMLWDALTFKSFRDKKSDKAE